MAYIDAGTARRAPTKILRTYGIMNSQDLGELIQKTRKQLGVTQKSLALRSETGIRFIIELEKGKSTCQIGKMLKVLQSLGIKLRFKLPLDAL